MSFNDADTLNWLKVEGFDDVSKVINVQIFLKRHSYVELRLSTPLGRARIKTKDIHADEISYEGGKIFLHDIDDDGYRHDFIVQKIELKQTAGLTLFAGFAALVAAETAGALTLHSHPVTALPLVAVGTLGLAYTCHNILRFGGLAYAGSEVARTRSEAPFPQSEE